MTDWIPGRCTECGELVKRHEEVWIDPETGAATMEGELFHPGCAPSVPTAKMMTVARKALDRLGLEWDVRRDNYDPDHPGIVIETPNVFFVTIGEDGRWMVGAWSTARRPDPPHEIADGDEDNWWTAIVAGVAALFRTYWSEKVHSTIYANEDLRPEGY